MKKWHKTYARQGKFLSYLKDDNEWVVRRVVAEQGVYLDELKDDNHRNVRGEALKQLEKVQ